MLKAIQGSSKLFEDTCQLIHLLTKSSQFRKNIPEALLLFSKHMECNRSFLIEMIPTQGDAEFLQYQRILEVPVLSGIQEHDVPQSLLDEKISKQKISLWLSDLAKISGRQKDVEATSLPTIYSSSRQDEVARKVWSEKSGNTIFSTLNVDFSAFVLFPLYCEENLWGFLLTGTSKEKTWSVQELMLGSSLCQLLANFLGRQYAENQRVLQQDLLSPKETPPSFQLPEQQKPDNGILSEQKFSQLITSTIPDSIFLVDIEQGKAVFSNTSSFLGYDIAGAENLINIFTSNIHPDDQEEAIIGFRMRLKDAKDEEIVVSEYRMRHKDGQWRWIKERAKVIDRFSNGMVKKYLSVMGDITKKKENELRVGKSERGYRNFITYTSEGIYYMNCGIPISIHLSPEEQTKLYYANAYIQECNQALAYMYKFDSQSDLSGQRVADLHRGVHYEDNQNAFQSFVENNYKVEGLETRELTTDGQYLYFAHEALGIIEDEQLIGIWGIQRNITSTRLAEKALRESESRLFSVLKDAQMGLWEWYWDDDLIHVNPIFLELVGIEKNNLVLTKEEFIEAIAEEDRASLAEALDYHLKNKTVNYRADLRMGRNPDQMRWVQIQGRLVESGPNGQIIRLSGSLLNIHEHKIAELLLEKREAFLEAVLNAIPDTKLRINKTGTILAVYASGQEKSSLQLDLLDVVGKSLEDIFPVFAAKGLLYNASKALRTKTLQTFEFLKALRNNDGVSYFEARINSINKDETIIILRDVTQLKMAEKALTEQIHKFDQKNRQLEKYIESNLQLENFAYIASHDLREPVRTMRTFGQFLKKRIGHQLDKDSKTHLDFIISGANRMNQLIEDLLTYSRVNSEPLVRESIASEELLNDIIASLKSSLEDHNATINIKSLPTTIYGSPVRLQQVFQNLIANAIKFHREGVDPIINISANETPTHWQFSIEDNGIGIDLQFHEQIFVIFKKLHNHQVYQGTGIGLTLVKSIVNQHGGEIWFSSTVGKGTTFSFTILK